MTLKCKICGISDVKILNFIVNHQFPPQFVGFIVNYPKSHRFVETEKLKSNGSVTLDNKHMLVSINKFAFQLFSVSTFGGCIN